MKNQNFNNIPASITEIVVRKYFPRCEASLAANMVQQLMPGHSIEIKGLIPGDEIQVAIKVLAGSRKALKL